MEYIGGLIWVAVILPDGSTISIIENANQSLMNEYQETTVKLLKGNNRIRLVATDKSNMVIGLKIEVGVFKQLGLNWQ